MRDPRHMEYVDRWAQFVRDNPTTWKKIHTEFINAQFEKAYGFYERLKRTPGGKAKIIEIFGIMNLEGYPSLKP
jgi:hypothetical protein